MRTDSNVLELWEILYIVRLCLRPFALSLFCLSARVHGDYQNFTANFTALSGERAPKCTFDSGYYVARNTQARACTDGLLAEGLQV